MYETENLTVNSGDLGLGAVVNFDLVISSRRCKIAYVKIVQLTAGAMDVIFETWESTAARAASAVRSNMYQKLLSRHIQIPAAQGGEYGESLTASPLPYFDRDAVDEERTYRIHCRLENQMAGTVSDFAVSMKIADPGEQV